MTTLAPSEGAPSQLDQMIFYTNICQMLGRSSLPAIGELAEEVKFAMDFDWNFDH